MKKILRPQPKPNSRTNRRVVMVKSVKGRIVDQVREGEVFRAQLVNVSSTGAQVYSNKTIENGTGMALDLDSLDGTHTVTYRGKVVWARKNPMKTMGRYAYGIHFAGMDAEMIKFLETNYSLSSPAED
jgi:c-di-GMP-binding flagellar brake protein YcgR